MLSVFQSSYIAGSKSSVGSS